MPTMMEATAAGAALNARAGSSVAAGSVSALAGNSCVPRRGSVRGLVRRSVERVRCCVGRLARLARRWIVISRFVRVEFR
jgi:hypothetical protein